MKRSDLETHAFSYSSVLLDREKFLGLLSEMDAQPDIAVFKRRVSSVREVLTTIDARHEDWLAIDAPEGAVSLRRDVLVSELDQILEARTIERAKYYLNRLERGVRKVRTGRVNDINLLRWKEYDDVITDSLWVLPKRDTSGAHLGWYWGNFVPQIPHQLLLRYTKKGDWVLDPFLGSGTTLIECRRLGRHGVGIELNPDVSRRAEELVGSEPNRHSVTATILTGDSTKADAAKAVAASGVNRVQLLVMHPPYHDIIRFSAEDSDLSNAASVDAFVKMFGDVVDNFTPLLDRGRYFALVIGDKYSGGEWIPLGFYCMSEVLKRAYSLKSIIVKNFDETRAKRDQRQLWRYRALVGGFYIFKHEYVFLFRKK
ncbi:MAG TPA: DNA methyltransferase [Blastocatellia bacterium]|jgi:hypothetical protein|nr:DNA methyltransferase [Blastocatellia bacterium]